MLTEQIIRTKLVSDQRWLEAALMALHNQQTHDEQRDSTTRHDNDRGFNSADANILSYYARWCRSGRHLSGNFLLDAQRRCQKYAKQLLRLALAKQQQTQTAA